MKRISLASAIFILTSLTLQAQKIYSTKTGRISFFSSAPLEDIEARTSEVESKLASGTGQVVFTLLMKGFKFENQLMEEHFNESYVESSKFPKSDFKGMITNIKDINFSKDGTYPAKVKGSLTIHGVTRETEANGTLEVKGASVTAKTKFVVKLGDYGISSKKIGKNIAETIAITVDCRYE